MIVRSASAEKGARRASTARRVSSLTRSMLIIDAALSPAAAAPTTCSMRLATLPATHTPGTSVAPEGSAAM